MTPTATTSPMIRLASSSWLVDDLLATSVELNSTGTDLPLWPTSLQRIDQHPPPEPFLHPAPLITRLGIATASNEALSWTHYELTGGIKTMVHQQSFRAPVLLLCPLSLRPDWIQWNYKSLWILWKINKMLLQPSVRVSIWAGVMGSHMLRAKPFPQRLEEAAASSDLITDSLICVWLPFCSVSPRTASIPGGIKRKSWLAVIERQTGFTVEVFSGGGGAGRGRGVVGGKNAPVAANLH